MAGRPAHLPPRVITGLVVAVILDTAVQVCWKLAAHDDPAAPSGHELLAVLRQPLFYAAMAGFGLQLWNWLAVLRDADVSLAQPFTALSYVTVLAASRFALGESVSPRQLAGVALILLGVFFVSRTSGNRPAPPPP